MCIVQQTRPANITENDWLFYLSKTPMDYLTDTAEGLEENNRYLVDERFQKLLFTFIFDSQSRYFAQRILQPPKEMFRARVYKKSDVMARFTYPEKYEPFQGYDSVESGAVPREKATSGRANPDGISYLYTASDRHTALLEARTQPGETVSIATVVLKERLCLFDLTKSISAIDAETEEKSKWINDFAFGLEHVFQAPYSAIGSYYLCQYISEFVNNWNFDGIMYRASHVQELGTPCGINYTIFDPSKCEVSSSKLYHISSVHIETMPKL